MSKKPVHVVPNIEGRWSVRKTGAKRATKVFASKEAAIGYARAKGDEIVVHRRDGRVLSISSLADRQRDDLVTRRAGSTSSK